MSVNSVTEDEAALIRTLARDGVYGEYAYAGRIWAPIEREKASGRASCRQCGSHIEQGTACIAFQFDPYGGLDRWGKLNKAYIHDNCGEPATKEEG